MVADLESHQKSSPAMVASDEGQEGKKGPNFMEDE